MIIYFDFNTFQTRFIQQQNEQKSFAVDFLMENAEKKDFSKIIEDFCKNNEEILNILKVEKNFVVLPDQVVGIDNLEVPTVQFSTKNKFFKTQFELLYNNKKNMIAYEKLYYKDKNKSIYHFAMTKFEIINQIIETFKKFNVLINGVSYFANVLSEYLFDKNKNFAKSNSLVLLNQNGKHLFAYCNGFVVGTKSIKQSKNKDSFAKKYAKFTQNMENLSKYLDKNFEKSISNTKLDTKKEDNILPKLEWLIAEFKRNIENSNYKFEFTKFFVLDKKPEIQVDYSNYFEIKEFSIEEILKKYNKSPFYFTKRGLWR